MSLHRIRKGLDLPVPGVPGPHIEDGPPVARVAILAADYVGLDPALRVGQGDPIKTGQPLLEDKSTPEVLVTAPGTGHVIAVNRDARGTLESVVIDLDAADEPWPFQNFNGQSVPGLSRDRIAALLVESGLWTAFHTRPFSRIPAPGTVPEAIFVTAIDTNPLAPDPEIVLAGNEKEFEIGLQCVAKLTEGQIYLCKKPGARINAVPHSMISVEEFQGPHPAGNVGLHIHLLEPVSRAKTVWHLGYQDVVAIGALIKTGKLYVDRVIALAGPAVNRSRLIRTRLGASIAELVRDQLAPGENRVISGSVLSGRTADGDVHGYLGRYHNQVSVIPEGPRGRLPGWLTPKCSFLNAFLGYKRVMPFNIRLARLLRSLAADDSGRAEQLGCLELDEEDLALCRVVRPSKGDLGPMLRRNLNTLEKKGRDSAP